ncbi:MAG: hypothetical protein V7L29_20920 [Nostoc sp.]
MISIAFTGLLSAAVMPAAGYAYATGKVALIAMVRAILAKIFFIVIAQIHIDTSI